MTVKFSTIEKRLAASGSEGRDDFLWAGTVGELFEHLPHTVFFVKDRSGRYLAASRNLAERVGLAPGQKLVGKHVRDLFPREFAERFAAQDERVMKTGKPLQGKLEVHWYPRRRAGWCLTSKLPLRNRAGEVVGLVGISRDLGALRDAEDVPAGLATALDYLEGHFQESLGASELARRAGLPAFRFARYIKRIFRITPTQLIAQTRITAATRLLQETQLAVADVALRCGFYDHSAFTRAFRIATGVTPRQFRQVHT